MPGIARQKARDQIKSLAIQSLSNTISSSLSQYSVVLWDDCFESQLVCNYITLTSDPKQAVNLVADPLAGADSCYNHI